MLNRAFAADIQKKPARQNVVMRFAITLSIIFFLFTLLALFTAQRHVSELTVTTGFMVVNTRAVSLLLAAIFLVYALFFWKCRRSVQEKNGWRWICIGAVLFIAILLVSPPFLSADVYGYVVRSIITTNHEINPYQIAPAELGYSSIVIWPEQVMRYGPVYVLYSLGLTRVAGDSIALNVIIYRLANIGWLVLSSWLIYKILLVRSREAARIGTAFFLWNPFILFEVVHSAHNDIMLLVAVLGALFLIQRQRYLYAIWVLLVGALIKYSLIVLIPFVVVLIFRQTAIWWKKIVTIIGAILGATIFTAVAYWPFGGWSSNVENLRGAFYSLEFITLPKAVVLSLVHLLGDWFSLDPAQLGWMTRNAYVGVFVLILLAALCLPGRSWRFESLVKRFFWVLLMLVMLLSIKLNIWYLVWILPLALLVDSTIYIWNFVLLTAFGLLFYNEMGVFVVTVLLWISMVLVKLFDFSQFRLGLMPKKLSEIKHDIK
ncbi:MAG: hypothetical protein HZC01_02360 [Candidatus Kerfeldbacteria bacterium]|nr:hypothetical protein [Candidatus Kerfeldbacteria bacterium]